MMEQQPLSNGRDQPATPWPGVARVLVCVGYNPASQRLIERASYLAKAFNGELIAVHIRSDDSAPPGYQTMLEHNMALARRRGARIVVERGAPLAEVIVRVARVNSVTHIVMGESARSRFDEVRRGSLVRQLLGASRGIDIYIVADPA
jgi:two-component system, OmpR family, sensor histidine kinase KdpD